jgi:hypothetical protein
MHGAPGKASMVVAPALRKMLVLALEANPVLIVPAAGLYIVYSAVKLYDGKVVESEVDRRRIR